MRLSTGLLFSFAAQFSLANPYWNPSEVPQDSAYSVTSSAEFDVDHLKTITQENKIQALRIQVDWQQITDNYSVSTMIIEPSGTTALLARSKNKPKWGSYLGVLKDAGSGKEIFYDSVGTGKEYRSLARAISLRFPVPGSDMIFELYAENPQTGHMEKVVEKNIKISELTVESRVFNDLQVKELRVAPVSPVLRVNIYAEGYTSNTINRFWQQANKVVATLVDNSFPGVEHMSFYAVFNPSVKQLGEARALGFPVPEFDSFLGLYYPYWDNFGRWFNVVYPTRENKFRQALASAPYDYPIVVINNSEYWGVGNYMSHTAIPAKSPYFTYLLLHELGHFFGLNEEYEGGGRTELEFAPEMEEPWSANITFLTDRTYLGLRWSEFVNKAVKIPTPPDDWKNSPAVYGAYRGGYADSISVKGASHKPGLNCIMESHKNFCDICKKGILDVVHYSLGMHSFKDVSLK